MGLGCTDLLGWVKSCPLRGQRSKTKLLKKLKPSHVKFRSSFHGEIPGQATIHVCMG